MPRTWRVVVAVALITIVGVGFSCRDATAVRLAIYSDVAWDNGRAVLLAANRSAAGSTEPQAAITSPWSSPYLGDIVLLPSSEPSLYVTVVMGVTRDAASCRLDAPDGCIVARRRTSFIEHKTLTVPVTMHASCLGVACSEDRTCNALGLCVSADVPASSCESPQGCFLPGDAPPDEFASTTRDSGPADAGLLDVRTPDLAFCSALNASILCNSFDDLDPSFRGWSARQMVNGGVVELGTGGAASPPGFLRASIDGGDASTAARGALLYVDTGTHRTLSWSADVRIQKRPGGDGGAEILEITDLATSWYFSINLLSDRDQVFEDMSLPDGSGVVNTTPMAVTIPVGSWHRVAFRLNWSNKTFDVSVDGTSAAAGPLIYAADSVKLQLAVGISYAQDFRAVVDFDNVVATE